MVTLVLGRGIMNRTVRAIPVIAALALAAPACKK